MNAYQIVSTFDRHLDYRLDTWERTVRKPKTLAAGNLPVGINVPMLARETLLAQHLRTGRNLNFNTTAGLQHPDKVSQPSAPKFNALTLAKGSEALKGKLIGVEIEFYPDSVYSLESAHSSRRGLTQVVEDGSLGNSGREVKRITWANADGRLHGITSLNLAGRITVACGLHVHIDVRHLDNSQRNATYGRLLGFYPFLKKLVPASRKRNKYCKWIDNRCTNQRYAAINWHSVGKYSTIEFRCQAGSLNPVKIETWALLCQFLVRFASDELNTIPRTWKQFIAILPEPLRSWCILRRDKLAGDAPLLTARTLSGIDLAFPATATVRA